MMLRTSLIFIVAILSIANVNCDLPVHCLAKHIAGQWTFFLGENKYDNTLTCGHSSPDKNTDHIFSKFQEFVKVKKTRTWELRLPNLVIDETGNQIGNWTMIFDEGFEVYANNQSFFAYSKYTFNGAQIPTDTDDEETKGYSSNCNETFLGWFQHNNNSNWGCFYGEKTTLVLNENENILERLPNTKIVEHNLSNLNKSFLERLVGRIPLYQMPNKNISKLTDSDIFKLDYGFIDQVNNEDFKSPWKAKAHENFFNKTHRQMKNLLGITLYKEMKIKESIKNKIDPISPELESDLSFLELQEKSKFKAFMRGKTQSKGQAWQYLLKKSLNESAKQYENSIKEIVKMDRQPCEGINESNVPNCFDWRNVNGENYDTPLGHQGECGSCYVMAAYTVIESRIRIRTKNKHKPRMSLSNILHCSKFNQGCNGGYPELVGKQGKHFGLYEDTCPKTENSCSDECMKGEKKWFVKDYGYVGKGYYGSSNEHSMMKEIFNRGPVIVAINASPDLYYYSTGVFITDPKKKMMQSNDFPDFSPWEFTNHAVACVGWGEQIHDGKLLKYWILKNSWGPQWGEGGYFKILRGINLAAVENQVVYIEPDLSNLSQIEELEKPIDEKDDTAGADEDLIGLQF